MASRPVTTRAGRKTLTAACLAIALFMLTFSGQSFAWWFQAAAVPVIKAQSCVYYTDSGRLVIKGKNFQRGATLVILNSEGRSINASVTVKGSKKIFVDNLPEADVRGGVDVKVINPDGAASEMVRIHATTANGTGLTDADVRRIIEQAAAQAEASGLKVTIAVTDSEGNVLAVFEMQGATPTVRVGAVTLGRSIGCADRPIGQCGLENVAGVPSCAAAISKAVTGAFLSSQGHAFSTRTASFIVQEHFPPTIHFQASGPLFGVQFSQLLCSDVNPRSPLGLAADAGGLPLYKGGIKVGGVGIEGDGKYNLDLDPSDFDVPPEELIAVAATRGFEAPSQITGDKIIVNGIRFPYVNAQMPAEAPLTAFNNLRGSLNTCLGLAPSAVRGAQPSKFRVITLDPSIPDGRVDDRFFPFKSGSGLTADEVRTILVQAARQAFIMRAAIRQPINSPTEVNMTVCDVDGTILGIFSTIDAPIFGFDVSAQKARTAAFFSNAAAGARLRAAGFGRYVDAAERDGVALNGSIAFSDRANGFLSRPFFPDGIDDTENGPFSVPFENFSPFNVGLQLDLVFNYFASLLGGSVISPCTPVPGPNIANGIQIFPGSVPLYKNGRLVGAIGVSGDGVDQDDLVSAMGSAGFESPPEIRSDRVFVRGIRLPFVKFPRHPNR
jgi:uncharacterized protein GlcG (DUF336 family)